ncbi:hypothetical protein VFPPC_17960 [Pochonia chlamydosporia 170]|uniref:Uncharacterized protein n=1 Tax=Pochonia chlamydosporia 170 TaxID=1380566 RepID=A0A219APV2_METCM|nr:hypothetical protein VFPPC_17960 [Pochonia chlamydosporia 170]OWT42847.1 hypothetical protein VFPPC_17960 [Pochonia chlamydosporia 170]
MMEGRGSLSSYRGKESGGDMNSDARNINELSNALLIANLGFFRKCKHIGCVVEQQIRNVAASVCSVLVRGIVNVQEYGAANGQLTFEISGPRKNGCDSAPGSTSAIPNLDFQLQPSDHTYDTIQKFITTRNPNVFLIPHTQANHA